MENIVRKEYLEVLKNLKDKNLIKVITGVRRCGKSTLMQQFQESIKQGNPDANVFSWNLDVPEFRFLAEKSWKELYDFISDALVKGEINYIFIDEVQNVPEFEKLLEGLYVHPDTDVYVTGSNAYLLSSELATLLTGRAYEISMLPFSFSEYIEASRNVENPERAFGNYIRTGGFPEAVNLSEIDLRYTYEYLENVFRNIYENDILKRHKIYLENTYREVLDFLMDSVGSLVSTGNIAKVLTSHGKKTDNKTVSRYIDTLLESFLMYKVQRFDVKGKQHLATLEKYYLVDTGLRHALLGKELDTDYGHLLENVVYLELLRRRYKVWVGKVAGKEVDFVCRTSEGYTVYYQVAYSIMNEETRKRELAPLEQIKDHNEKILLTMDYETGSRNGIRQINVIDWLLNKN